MNAGLKERAKIHSLKLKITHIKSEYSGKIALLESRCRQLDNRRISAGVLTDKLKEKQNQKRIETEKEIMRLNKELNEKVAPFEKELEEMQQHQGKSTKEPKKQDETDKTDTKSFFKRHKVLTICGIVFGMQMIALGILSSFSNTNKEVDYEEYDLRGLTVKEACEKARSAGWKVNKAVSIEGDDKTDCYNTEIIVTDYYYSTYSGTATIYFGEKKSNEQKQAECEATGKWYRDGQCKSEEEWENQYKWSEAHAACKKYGSSGYAKTLTDCYVGDQYMGPVNGEPQTEANTQPEQTIEEIQIDEPKPAEEPQSSTSTDDPTKMPEDELSTAIVVCKRVIKQTYGIDVKTTEYARSYWYGEDYVWLISFMNGKNYTAVTCKYNWKTGRATSDYINW